MGKTEIAKRLAKKIYGRATDFEVQECMQICDALPEIFTEALLDGEKIIWKGFITAEVVERGARHGRNPKTNEVEEFPPSKSLRCKFSKSIRDMIKEKR